MHFAHGQTGNKAPNWLRSAVSSSIPRWQILSNICGYHKTDYVVRFPHTQWSHKLVKPDAVPSVFSFTEPLRKRKLHKQHIQKRAETTSSEMPDSCFGMTTSHVQSAEATTSATFHTYSVSTPESDKTKILPSTYTPFHGNKYRIVTERSLWYWWRTSLARNPTPKFHRIAVYQSSMNTRHVFPQQLPWHFLYGSNKQCMTALAGINVAIIRIAMTDNIAVIPWLECLNYRYIAKFGTTSQSIPLYHIPARLSNLSTRVALAIKSSHY